MRCGYFEDQNREYVIDNPKTPIKWVNYLGSLEFGGLVDHTGGLLLCKGDPALNRITKYIPQLPSSQFKGHTLYLRFADASQPSGYKVFSPFFVPTLDPHEYFRSRVGLGYQRIESKMHGIESDVRLFIPQGASVCLMQVRVRNTRPEAVKLDACPLVEYTHFDALKQFTNADWVPQTMQSRLKEADGTKLLVQYAFMKRETALNFLSSDKPFSSFSSDRAQFLGDWE
jgi:cellobiose phosphorylase